MFIRTRVCPDLLGLPASGITGRHCLLCPSQQCKDADRCLGHRNSSDFGCCFNHNYDCMAAGSRCFFLHPLQVSTQDCYHICLATASSGHFSVVLHILKYFRMLWDKNLCYTIHTCAFLCACRFVYHYNSIYYISYNL